MSTTCPRCGRSTGGAATCPACGTPTSSADPSRSTTAIAITAIIASAVVVVVAAVLAVVVLSGRDDPVATTASPTTVEAPVAAATPAPTQAAAADTPSSSPSAVASAAPEDAGPGDVRDLPAGLFCRDLRNDGYSYSAAVEYWRDHGQTNQMDEERNGIPCQTVYDPRDVSAYWGTVPVPEQVALSVSSLPSGLFCRDLLAQGWSYSDAVSYWYVWGQPAQMDLDLNGIPCETVYPRALVDGYWFS